MTAGALMLDLGGTELTPQERSLLVHPQVGGVIFFSRNFISLQQFIALVAEVNALRPELLLAVDQEGGRVQRLREGYTNLPPMQTLGDLLAEDWERAAPLIRDAGWLMAVEVIASGLDFSFAPVLDLDRNQCAVIANRAFSDDPDRAIAAARLFIAGMHDAGMAVTGKHFPGHGGVLEDSHLQTPYDRRTFAELWQRDLKPFRELAAELDAVMPAHVVFADADPLPVGFSRYWLQQVLRKDLNFSGVIFSDDLAMKGADVMGDYATKAAAALNAGCDMVLVCNDRAGALEVIEFLERRQTLPSPRLKAMKAKRRWAWPDLVLDSRRQATAAALLALV